MADGLSPWDIGLNAFFFLLGIGGTVVTQNLVASVQNLRRQFTTLQAIQRDAELALKARSRNLPDFRSEGMISLSSSALRRGISDLKRFSDYPVLLEAVVLLEVSLKHCDSDFGPMSVSVEEAKAEIIQRAESVRHQLRRITKRNLRWVAAEFLMGKLDTDGD